MPTTLCHVKEQASERRTFTGAGIDATNQEDRTDASAINDTRIKRLLVRVALRTTARFFKRQGTCIPITRSKIVKVGARTHLSEAVTMQFIAERASLVVPRVYCAFVHKGRAYLVMERIRGDQLDSLPEDRRRKACAMLKTALKDMRDIQPPPGTGVASSCGGSLTDPRIPWAPRRFGPFSTIHDFHSWLRKGMTLEDLYQDTGLEDIPHEMQQDLQDLRDAITRQDSPWPAPVFTHGDLNGGNILVREDNVPVVIDWECAGWYPTYWEYTSAIWTGHTWTSWPSIVDQFLDPVPPEVVKMEEVRNRYWGDF